MTVHDTGSPRLPAEWEPHEATWLGWPHNPTDWPGRFMPIPWVYAEIVRKLSRFEQVRILVNDAAHEAKARGVLRRANVCPDRVAFYQIPTNRGWTRDFMPAFVQRDKRVEAVKFRFTGWAKYEDHALDDAVFGQLKTQLGLDCRHAALRDLPVALEGGGIDANGQGTLLTTEECYLDPDVQVRNPGFSISDYERVFCEELGIAQTIWLGRGIAGDDTHGHVDDLCRFVNPSTVVLCREDNPQDDNYAPLAENFERLQNVRLANGAALNVIALPMPAPVVFEGLRLPASYANFYIANGTVIVPTFNDPADRVALGILSECFPDRDVVGIHALDLVWGLGTLHCLTHEQPAQEVNRAIRR